MKVETKSGSATSPRPTPTRGIIIAHLTNVKGAWGAGFVLAIDELSPVPRAAYKALAKQHKGNIPLGFSQFVNIEPRFWVVNMTAQIGTDRSQSSDGCLVDYNALDSCVRGVFGIAIDLGCDVHIPAGIGSGLAGGDKAKIRRIIDYNVNLWALSDNEIETTVTLWDFTDTTAVSYIPQSSVAADISSAIDELGL